MKTDAIENQIDIYIANRCDKNLQHKIEYLQSIELLRKALKQAEEENASLRAERDAAEERGWNLARERVYTPIGGWQNKYETYAEAVKEKNGSK